MVWGQRASIDDLLNRIRSGALTSLTLLPQRRLDGPNDVQRLCDALAQTPCLTELSLGSHALDAASTAILASLLASTTSLRSLTVGTSSFGDAGVLSLAPGLAASCSLTSLDLANKGVGEEGGRALGAALAASSSVAHLALGDNPLGDAGLMALCSPAWTGALRHLHLSACQLSASCLPALAAQPGLANLLSLNLSCNPQFSGSEAADGLVTLVLAASHLTRLELQQTGVGDSGVQAVAGAVLQLGGSCRLQQLDVSDTGCSDACGPALAAALSAPSCSLRSLAMASNRNLGAALVASLSASLTSPSWTRHDQQPVEQAEQGQPCSTAGKAGQGGHTLVEKAWEEEQAGQGFSLDLSGCPLVCAGLEHLARPACLTRLQLLGCKLGNDGAASLARLLRDRPSDADCGLTVPVGEVVGANPAGRVADDVAQSREGHGDESGPKHAFSGLRDLVLSGCDIGISGATSLLDALVAGGAPRLTSLEIGGNPVCQQDTFGRLIEDVRAKRPGLQIHWRAGDEQETAQA